MDEQATAYFPGVRSVLACDLTLSSGISPSVITLQIALQDTEPATVGDFVLRYGSSQIRLRDCRVDKGTLTYSESGGYSTILTLFDRRWRWQFGTIYGEYNLRQDNGEIIKDRSGKKQVESLLLQTERTPKEIAELIFEAMGEQNYNIDDLPDDVRPIIQWPATRCDQALDGFCKAIGFVVILGTDDVIYLRKAGDGAELNVSQHVQNESRIVEAIVPPDSIEFVPGPNRYQVDFLLYPVANEGEVAKRDVVVDLDDASYKPPGGWSAADLPAFNMIKDLKLRGYAKESVYRWYEIGYDDKKTYIPGYDGEPLDVRQLNIEDEQVETVLEAGLQRNKKAQIHGIFYTGLDDFAASADKVTPDPETKAIYKKPFTIDKERGIVKFSEPVFKYVSQSGGGFLREPADLRLRVAVSVRDPKTRAWQRKKIERKTGFNNGTRPESLVHEEVNVNYTPTYETNYALKKVENNEADIRKIADYYINIAEAKYKARNPQTVTYFGIIPIQLDGAIQQVSWRFSDGGPAQTVASRNDEQLEATISFADKELIQRTKKIEAISEVTRQPRKVPSKPFLGSGVGFA